MSVVVFQAILFPINIKPHFLGHFANCDFKMFPPASIVIAIRYKSLVFPEGLL